MSKHETQEAAVVTHVNIYVQRGGQIKEKRISESVILGTNAEYLVISDLHFTTLQRKKKGKYEYAPVLESVRISRNDKDNFWEEIFGFLTISVYSTQSLKAIERLINKTLNDYIKKELSFFGSFQGLQINLTTEQKA
jgi:hypothetical protein